MADVEGHFAKGDKFGGPSMNKEPVYFLAQALSKAVDCAF